MTCPTCKLPCDTIRSLVRRQKILTGCDKCLSSQLTLGNEYAAKHIRDYQRTEYRRDITQSSDPRAFIKAHPEKAQERYSEETYRKYS